MAKFRTLERIRRMVDPEKRVGAAAICPGPSLR